MHPDLKALVVAAVRDPADALARRVLADWLDEHGDPATAYALRWMVRNGREPFATGQLRTPFASPVGATWVWALWPTAPARGRRRMPREPWGLPECVSSEMRRASGEGWLTVVRELGRALARVKAMVDL
jgi:uncharacterized protein (TIGR02996 family)